MWCPECKRYQVQQVMIGGDAYGPNTRIYRCDFCAHAWSQRIRDNQREIEGLAPSRSPARDPMSQFLGGESCDFCLCDHRYSHKSWCPTRADLNDKNEAFIASMCFMLLQLEGREITPAETERRLDRHLRWTCARCGQVNGRHFDECGRCMWARESQSDRGVAMVRSYGPGETEFDTYRPFMCAIPHAAKMQVMRSKAAAFCDGYYCKAWEDPETKLAWEAWMIEPAHITHSRRQRDYNRCVTPLYVNLRARILDGDGFDDQEMSGDYLRSCQIALEHGR